ncbi:MAG TPA: transporter [Planctomycetaceae bacterium]|nr:transporter [Planctomycetaceae bacterium]
MLSRFFIERPVFASVLSILITLAGGLSARHLAVAPYPTIAPPTIQVDCNYPGASAQVVAQTVAAPIEQQVTGVEDMLYMASQSTNDGSYTLTVTFKPGVDLNLAQVLVQNRVALAQSALPDVVRQIGVTTKKRSPDILLTVSINSPDGRYDQLHLSNYALLRIRDELARLPGIAEVLVFGQRDYSLRVWLDPDRLAVRHLSVSDVIAAIREQNMQISLGQLGQPPSDEGGLIQIPLTTRGRLIEPEEFAEIIVRVGTHGQTIRIGDLGTVELGARAQDIANRFDGKPTVGLAIFQLPNANALETADLIQQKMRDVSRDFPEGIVYQIGYDTTPFIRESIFEVFHALRDAVILVAVVVLVFLKGWRAAVIPLLAIPVAIVGTGSAMALAGFSINNLTLFGLVLAIGIVVDDAIVVVEAVEHHMEQGLTPKAAAIQAMEEVSGPVIAVGLVLSAVFVPCAFVSGIVGQFFRQFALTISVSTILSTINSLTLSPALAALLLRPASAPRDPLTRLLDLTLGWLFWLFDRGFRVSTNLYLMAVGKLLRIPLIVLVVYAGLLWLTQWEYRRLPTGFIPTQDKGFLVASVQLPDATAAVRSRAVMSRIEKLVLSTPGVKNVNAVAGNSFLLSAYGSNFGSMFIILEGFRERAERRLTADSIMSSLREKIALEIPEAVVNVFPPPAVSGLGRAGGFKLMVEQRGEMNLADLQHQTDELIRKANQQPEVTGLFTVYKANSPQLFADVDREKCLKHGVALADVFATLQACLGSRYVNDFNRFGRTWQVIVQADSQFRDDLSDVHRLKVRNRAGKMVPLGAVADFQLRSGPLVLSRYNMYPAAAIQGNVSAGYSTGQAIAMLENLAGSELPAAMASEWTEITYLERISRNTGMFVFGLSVAFVFLVLAALYESWSLPLAVILVVPMCVLCSLLGVDWARMDVNIFTQIGFVVLIGLACKNAILIVEFAKSRREAGADCRTATLHACELRLRPILMTSLAFILGVVPLVIARGAGAEMRRTLGTAVFSGMLGVTLFGIFLTPVFFLVIDQASEWPMFRTRWPGRWSRHFLDLLRLSFLWRPWSDQVRQIVRGLRTPQASPTGDQTQASPRDLRLPSSTDESLTGSIQRLASSLTELSPPEPDPHTLGSPSS